MHADSRRGDTSAQTESSPEGMEVRSGTKTSAAASSAIFFVFFVCVLIDALLLYFSVLRILSISLCLSLSLCFALGLCLSNEEDPSF